MLHYNRLMNQNNIVIKSIEATKVNQPNHPCTFNLDHLGSIYIHGKDAQHFLQGLLTCDVDTLATHKAQPTIVCNIQGRIVALLFLMRWQEGYLLVLPQDILTSTLKHFKKYALFSKVVFEVNAVPYLIGFSEKAPDDAYPCLDTLFIQLCFEAPGPCLNREAWHYQQMIRGFPDIYPTTQALFLPHRLELEKINSAISFNKGCYLGQEIIARTHFKAKQKHAIYLCKGQIDFHPGEDLFDDEHENVIGEVIDVANLEDSSQYFLAAIKLESTEQTSLQKHKLFD